VTSDSSSKLRLLCVINKPPTPQSSGSRVRLHHLLEGFASEFLVDTVLVGRWDESERAATQVVTSGRVEVVRQLRCRANRPNAVLTDLLFGTRWRAWDVPATKRLLQEYVAATAPDVVWASGCWAAPVLPWRAGVPIVVDLQHDERRSVVDDVLAAPTVRALVRALSEAPARLWAEAQVVRKATGITTAGAAVRAARTPHAVVVDNGASPLPISTRAPETGHILFVGNLHYSPNRDGIVWFLREVLPRVKSRLPFVYVSVVGDGNERLGIHAPPDVRFYGFVPSLSEFYRSAEVVVAPLRRGSGTKTKVLEAMAQSVPVVTTPVGIEGLDVRHEVHILVATTSAEFADAIIDSLLHPNLSLARARAAYVHVTSQFNWVSAQQRSAGSVRQAAERGCWSPSGKKTRPA